MKKILSIVIFILQTLFATSLFCQVGIGTMSPDKSAALDVRSTELGVLIPCMSETDRDHISSPANGLLIFNITEECINSYDKENKQWHSLCGGVAKSTFSIDCDEITVYGAYMQKTPLNGSDYLTITVDVAKAGMYTLSANTANGYGFYAAGTFLSTGPQQVTLAGQGSPVDPSDPGDIVSLVANGIAYDCGAAVATRIPVATANPTFSMTCGSVNVNGTYVVGTSLKPTHSINIDVTVSVVGTGQWSAETDTQDGIFFSNSGVFSSTGTQTITLLGHGTPTSARTKTMTITVNSAGVSKTCSATIPFVITPKSIVVMGSSQGMGEVSNTTYGYSMNASASRAVAMNPANFGTPTSVVPMTGPLSIQGLNNAGMVGIPGGISTNPSGAQIQNLLASTTPPDILLIGWGMVYDATGINAIINYLNNGGVVIIMNKYSGAANGSARQLNGEQALFSSLFGSNVTASFIRGTNGTDPAPGATNGVILSLPDKPGDPILNGPFNKGLTLSQWGGDWYSPVCMTGIPDNQIIVYSDANVKGGSGRTGVSMFRHKTLNLFWVGDGGFLSNSGSPTTWDVNYSGTNNTRPFNISGASTTFVNSNNIALAIPAPRSNYGSSATYGGTGQLVYNSQLFANVLAWAIRQAEDNGINAGQKSSTGSTEPDPEPDNP